MTTMEPGTTGHEAIDHNELPVHTWRVAQLTRLGIPRLLTEIHSDYLDWHQIARLAQRGCLTPMSGPDIPVLCGRRSRGAATEGN
jgi:hypothetical protein